LAQHYRYWIIWRCPSVRFLDFVKVKDAERQRAEALFGTKEQPTELAQTVSLPFRPAPLSTRLFSEDEDQGQSTTDTEEIMNTKSKSYIVPTYSNGDDTTASSKARIWTDDEKKRMRAAIQNASSLQEMARLEKDFAEGRIPAYVLEGGEPMET
jgi:hypothetical protein